MDPGTSIFPHIRARLWRTSTTGMMGTCHTALMSLPGRQWQPIDDNYVHMNVLAYSYIDNSHGATTHQVNGTTCWRVTCMSSADFVRGQLVNIRHGHLDCRPTRSRTTAHITSLATDLPLRFHRIPPCIYHLLSLLLE